MTNRGRIRRQGSFALGRVAHLSECNRADNSNHHKLEGAPPFPCCWEGWGF